MNEKPALQREYHIPLPMFQEAFRSFQKKYVFPKNAFLSVILAAIAGVYIHAAIKDNTQTMAYILIVICLAMIVTLWYRPLKIRGSLAEALKELENDIYELKLYDDKLTIRTEDAPKPAEANETEEPAAQTEPESAAAESETEEGFQKLFPETPANADAPEQIPPTEIYLDSNVKFHEYDTYFIVYLVKQNFYVIPKKDFSESEIGQLRAAFRL